MVDAKGRDQQGDQEAVERDDADAGLPLDDMGKSSELLNLDDSATPRKKQDFFASRGFQILVAVLFTILVLTLCASLAFLTFLGAAAAATPVVVTLFGVLITGIFVFMTLRTESGAKKEAQAVAQVEAQYQADIAARAAATTEARRVAEEAGRVAEAEARSKAEVVARQVAEHEFERMRDIFARRPR